MNVLVKQRIVLRFRFKGKNSNFLHTSGIQRVKTNICTHIQQYSIAFHAVNPVNGERLLAIDGFYSPEDFSIGRNENYTHALLRFYYRSKGGRFILFQIHNTPNLVTLTIAYHHPRPAWLLHSL